MGRAFQVRVIDYDNKTLGWFSRPGYLCRTLLLDQGSCLGQDRTMSVTSDEAGALRMEYAGLRDQKSKDFFTCT
jgi:hypothetical protein